MKKQSIFSLTLVVLCLLFVLVANKYSTNVNSLLTKGGECTLQDRVCQFVDELGSISINFEQLPVVEEEMNVEVRLSEHLLLKNAWVEGINMYMGKIPIIPRREAEFNFENRNLNAEKLFHGLFFLGSCTEPSMQWAMVLEVENKNTLQSSVYRVRFTTKSD